VKKTRRLSWLCLTFFASAEALSANPPAASQAEAINTDRPSFSNSSVTVPKDVFQIESGWIQQAAQNVSGTRMQLTQTPVLLRFGFMDHLEARLGTDGYTWQKTGSDRTEGLGDSSLGFKWHHKDQRGAAPAIASLMTVVFPSGNREIRGRGVRPVYELPLDWTLSPALSFTVMPGVAWNATDAGRHYAAPLTSALANYGWTAKFQTFVEWAGQQFAEPRLGGTVLTADGGATYLLTRNIQIDGAIGWGLNRFSPNVFSTAGLSLRY
jgi:Putative MetA-pathway of phenol degradation